MKLKHTFILLLIAGLLWGYVEFIDRHQPSTKELEDLKGKVFTFDRDQISAISIKAPEGKIELKKDGRQWSLHDPVKDRADSLTMNMLLTSIDSLRAEQTIDQVTKEQIKEYGIADSQTKLTLTVDGKRRELIFGRDTALPSKGYAMIEGEKEVLVLPNTLRNEISKKADEFRDRKLSDLTLNQVNKAIIKTGAGEIEVERKDNHWFINRPLKARGDDSKIGDLISLAIAARVEAFMPDVTKLGENGLEQPRGTITLSVEGDPQPQVLLLGNDSKDEKGKLRIYAKLSSRNAVVVLPQSLEKFFVVRPNDLRDRKLVQFTNDLVDRITIEPTGKEKLVFARSGAKAWVRKAEQDVPVYGALLTRLLDDLGAAMVSDFVSDVATELPKYGLDQPQLTVTLSAFSSENTAETKAGERPILTLLLGKEEADNLYARVDDEPFIVSTPKTLLDSIPTDATQLQPLEIYQFKPEEIASLEVTREGHPTLNIERDKENHWKLAKGDDKLNEINVQSLVNTLATLRSVRWIGPPMADHGLMKPVATVTFKTTANAGGKLTIGRQSPEKMRYASADGLKGTFLIASPDFEAFVTGLTEKPAGPATPAPPATNAAPGKNGASAPGAAINSAPVAPMPDPVPSPNTATPQPGSKP
jgi:hypothetical protein